MRIDSSYRCCTKCGGLLFKREEIYVLSKDPGLKEELVEIRYTCSACEHLEETKKVRM